MLAAGLALLASCCYGVSNFVGPAISRDLPVYSVLIAGQDVAFGASAVMAAAVVLLTATLRAPLRSLPRIAIPGLLLFAGTLAYSSATREGDLSVVSVLGSLFPLVTVGLAFAAGERLSRAQSLGVVAALAGVVLVSVEV